MLSKSLFALVAALAVCSAGEAAAISVKAEMKTVVEPASNTLFAVGGEVDPENGADAAKVPDKRWKEAGKAAAALKAAGEGLVAAEHAKPGEDWPALARQMAEIGERAATAAAAKDGKALAQAANDLGDNCSACHAKYKPQDGG